MESTFNNRLILLLQKSGLTQKELAQRAGVTEAAMSHYIKGDRSPRASVIARIAEVLGTTTDYLLSGSQDGCNEIEQVHRLIARNVHQMSKKEKMAIIDLLMSEN